MSLTNTAYLVLETSGGDDDDTTEAVFQLDKVDDVNISLEKYYLFGGTGQFAREADRLVSDATEFAEPQEFNKRRTGYWVDIGSGDSQNQISFENGLDDVTWGDGSGGKGPDNVTKTDASGSGVDPLTRMQVLEHWIARTRSDSLGYCRLHLGQYTNGRFGNPGVYEEPIPIAVRETNFEKPEDDVNTFTGTVVMSRVAVFDTTDDLASWLGNVVTAIFESETIPDF